MALTALLAATVALAGGEPSIDAKLRVTDKAIDAGERTGLIVKNTGERRILHGLGARIERRAGGRWVDVPHEQCLRGCEVPDVGLVLRPGETGGPSYGSLRDAIRLSREARSGRYRLTKTVRNANHPRRGKERIREVIHVR